MLCSGEERRARLELEEDGSGSEVWRARNLAMVVRGVNVLRRTARLLYPCRCAVTLSTSNTITVTGPEWIMLLSIVLSAVMKASPRPGPFASANKQSINQASLRNYVCILMTYTIPQWDCPI